jgi:hypothetical protein
MKYHVRSYESVASFEADVSVFLNADEDANALLIGLLKFMSIPNSEVGVPVLRAVYENGKVVGVALRTGDTRALIGSNMPAAAVPLLWESVAKLPVSVKELNGPDEFVDQMITASKLPFKVFMYLGSFRLTEVTDPQPAPGFLRVATADDVDTLEIWNQNFALEAMSQEDPQARAKVERLLKLGSMYVWETDGQIVCQTYSTQPMGSSIKITGVYTPTQLRGKGYASNCVAGITRKLLTDGYKKIFLYTDLANPTSNSIYQKIGYMKFSSMKHVKLEA